MAGYPSPPADPGLGASGGYGGSRGNISTIDKSKPILEKTKSVGYNITTSDQIFAISTDVSATAAEALPQLVEVENTGGVSVILMCGYSSYTDDTTIDATDYLHVFVGVGEKVDIPVRAVISSDADKTLMFGTAVDNLAPDSNEYTDSGENCTGLDNTTDPVTLATTGAMFRVADLIRVENEIMEVTAISGGDVTVKRGMFGSDPAPHADASDIRFPFFNAYHDFDKYSVAQTDSNGKFKCSNFFGQGRSASGVQGLTAGSGAIKFYEAGYCGIGLSGQTSSSETSLTAGGSYFFKIAIDGGTAENHNFTVDSSNTKWGGTNGVLTKIKEVLDDKYNNSASNTFQQKSSVALKNGDVVFTSGQRLSTSQIRLTAGAGGASDHYNLFTIQSGHIPALANVPDPVDARLQSDVLYDRVTYATIPNSSVFGYDDGNGNLFGKCTGKMNYETGAVDFVGPPNAEFVVSALTNSAFSGRLNESINSLTEITAVTPNQKWNGSVKVKSY